MGTRVMHVPSSLTKFYIVASYWMDWCCS